MSRRFTNSHRGFQSACWTLMIAMLVTGLYLVSPLGSAAQTAEELRSDIARKRAKEGVLTGDIQRMSQRIRGLRGRIETLQRQQNSAQSDLDAVSRRQQAIAAELASTRARLKRIKRKLTHAKDVLSKRIVQIYKEGQPDIITVVLESDGFAQMVERTTYLSRIAEQDRSLITAVKRLKSSTTTETVRLAGLERSASKLVAQAKVKRDQVAQANSQLKQRQTSLGSAVAGRKSMLASVSRSRRADEEDLVAMARSNSQVQGILGDSGGPAKRGSGKFVYPVNGQFTSPFGSRWGRLHAGIDIAVPTGTPVHAADSGTVRYAGWMSGYGNYTCVQHTNSLSSCYAHQSSISVKVGQSVRQGQVMGQSGNTGNSTGPHMHFEARLNGTPVDPMGYL